MIRLSSEKIWSAFDGDLEREGPMRLCKRPSWTCLAFGLFSLVAIIWVQGDSMHPRIELHFVSDRSQPGRKPQDLGGTSACGLQERIDHLERWQSYELQTPPAWWSVKEKPVINFVASLAHDSPSTLSIDEIFSEFHHIVPELDVVIKPVMKGTFKSVHQGRLVWNTGKILTRDVAVKRLKLERRWGKLQLPGESLQEIQSYELYRGMHVVPDFFGGWLDIDPITNNPELVILVEWTGSRFLDALGGSNPKFLALAQRDRRDGWLIAQRIVEMFEKLDSHGCVVVDFDPSQFAITDSLELRLVDLGACGFRAGPLTHSSFKQAHKPPLYLFHIACNMINGNSPYTPLNEATGCLYTDWLHCCCRSNERMGVTTEQQLLHLCGAGAPESKGYCRDKRCVRLSQKTHVFDIAAKPWLFPSLFSHDSTILSELQTRMMSVEPENRPTLAEVGDLLARLAPKTAQLERPCELRYDGIPLICDERIERAAIIHASNVLESEARRGNSSTNTLESAMTRSLFQLGLKGHLSTKHIETGTEFVIGAFHKIRFQLTEAGLELVSFPSYGSYQNSSLSSLPQHNEIDIKMNK